MPQNFQYDVFISYSSKDQAVVLPLAERLREDGLRVWFDDWEIRSGENITEKIEQGLERSRALVLCMSANAFGSDWPRLESRTFRFRDPVNQERRFIPLRLDSASIKDSLAQYLYINWLPEVREREYTKLLQVCLSDTRKQLLTQKQEQFQVTLLSLGHADWIRSVAWSPDGQRALSGADDHTMRLWEVGTGRCLRVFEGHNSWVTSVAWSPDGQQTLSGSTDTTMRLWEVGSGRCLRVLEGHGNAVLSVAWSPDGQQALSGSDDATMRLWEVGTGRCLRIIEGHSAGVSSVAWSANGQQALSGSDDQTMRLWDVGSGRCLRVFEDHNEAVESVAWGPDGQQALSGSDDHTVRLWEVGTGLCLQVFEGHSAEVLSVAWSPDGQRVLSGSIDNTMRLWEVDSGLCPRVFEGHSGSVLSVAWSPDGQQALSGSSDKTVRLWDIGSGPYLRVFEGHSGSVMSMVWSPDRQLALSGGRDHTVRLWDVGSGRCLQVFESHSADVVSVAWSPGGQQALSGSDDQTMRLWEVASGRCLRVFEDHSGVVLNLVWSPDGQQALSGSDDHTVRLWEVASGRCLRVFEGHSAGVRIVAWSPDGLQALSGSDDATMRLWEVGTGRCLQVFEGHSAEVLSVAWSPDGQRVLSGSIDNTMRLWEVDSGLCPRVFEGHSASVNTVAWSPDGKQALSGSDDHAVRLWDVASGRCLRVFEGHSVGVWSVAWGLDGHQLFSSAWNGVMRIWEIGEPTHQGEVEQQVQYTNAKVLLVGESGAGKTGLSKRLALDNWEPSDSTVGAWATQWKLPVSSDQSSVGIEREIWLWDFGGQADQRLIHQLYMDETALAVLVFDGQKEDLFETLGQWDRDLTRASRREFTKLLVAGRVDAGGLRVSRNDVEKFAAERNFHGFLETSAKQGLGCEELKQAILTGINWDQLPCRTTVVLFKRLKEEIIRLKDEGRVLMRFNELREALQLRLSHEFKQFSDEELRAVLTLLAGPGVVWELAFGSWVLLQPERINAYAQAVIQTMRDDPQDRGCITEEMVLAGKLKNKAQAQVSEDEERIILLAMHQKLVARGLCLREQSEVGMLLVFPAYYRRERPELVGHPDVQVSYRFSGFLDEIYATLVVRLHHAKNIDRDQLWRYAADFKTATGHKLGVKLRRLMEGMGELEVYFEPTISVEDKITFSKFIHEHITQRGQGVVRLRHYVCPNCLTPVGYPDVAMKRLAAWQESQANMNRAGTPADDIAMPTMICSACEERFSLWDEMEQAFVSPEIQQRVRRLQDESTSVLESQNRERRLIGEVISTVMLAGQISRELAVSDHGIDMEIEFKNDEDKPTGRKLYLHLKPGADFVWRRSTDETEIIELKNELNRRYWMAQSFPVFLVVQHPDGEVRWMEVRELLRKESEDGKRTVSEIVFRGERLDVMSVRHWRDRDLEYIRDSLLEELSDGRLDEALRCDAARRLAAWPESHVRDRLLVVAGKAPSQEIRAACCESLCDGWWKEREVRRWIRSRSKDETSDYVSERIERAIQTARKDLAEYWISKLSGQTREEKEPEMFTGYPAFRAVQFRLMNIGPFIDTGELTLQPDINLFLGDNAAGKTTLMRCLSLAAIGAAAANEVVDNPAGFLRKGTQKGSIEVLFEVLPDPDSLPMESAHFATGLAISAESSRFEPLEKITLHAPDSTRTKLINNAEPLSALRSKGTTEFGFVVGYGAVRTFGESRFSIQPELKKRENEWVLSLFRPEAWLVNPEVLSKLVRGDTSNIEEAPTTPLPTKLLEALKKSLKHLVPDVTEFFGEGDNDLQLSGTPLRYGELSDGYRSLFALVGHLLRCALKVCDWQTDPTTLHGIALIDEMDLHLHPSWQTHVIKDFREAFKNLQLIASTHSPMVVAALKKENVFVMQREDDGSVRIEHPSVDPQGMGFGGILKSDIFGFCSNVDSETLKLLNHRNYLYSKGNERTSPEDAEMQRLSEELSRLGFATDFKDPYYAKFVAQMAQNNIFHRPELTAQERKEQDDVANEIIKAILAEGSQK